MILRIDSNGYERRFIGPRLKPAYRCPDCKIIWGEFAYVLNNTVLKRRCEGCEVEKKKRDRLEAREERLMRAKELMAETAMLKSFRLYRIKVLYGSTNNTP